MAARIKLSEEDIIEALRASRGIVTVAIQWLYKNKNIKISRQQFYNKIKGNEKIAAVRKEIEEEMMDFVESKFFQLLYEGDKGALIFYLKTKAKSRGYIERQELTGKDGRELNESKVVILELPDNGRD